MKKKIEIREYLLTGSCRSEQGDVKIKKRDNELNTDKNKYIN